MSKQSIPWFVFTPNRTKMKNWSIFIFVLLLIGCFGDCKTNDYDIKRQCSTSDFTIKGVDVSYYQGNINWSKVANNDIVFGIARVSDGLYKIDPMFIKNWKEMDEAGLIRGVYQFFRPEQSAEDQAMLLIELVNEAGGFRETDLPCVIDIEVTGGLSGIEVAQKLSSWIRYIEAATNKKPIIYTGSVFWDTKYIGSEFSGYPLWTANYTTNKCPYIADPWSEWTFWQFTDSGAVDGINVVVDVNVYSGTKESLLKFAMQKIENDLEQDAGIDSGDDSAVKTEPSEDPRIDSPCEDCGSKVWSCSR